MNVLEEAIQQYLQEIDLRRKEEIKKASVEKEICVEAIFPELVHAISIPQKKTIIKEVPKVVQRDSGNKVIYGRLSKVRIHDPEDAVEVAIKNNIELYVPYKSWNEIFSIIGEDVLHDVGILDLKQSFYKRKAQELIAQYGVFELTGGTKYERCCTVLYEEPKFDIEIITEGNRFYRDRGVPLLLRFLKRDFEMKGSTLYCTTEMIAKSIGLVNARYGMESKDLIEIYPKLTDGIVHQFYLYSKPELEKVVHGLLGEIQKNYKAIDYQKLHWVTTETGERFCTDEEQEKLIKEAEKLVLQRDFHTERISTVFYRKKQDAFYSAVMKHLNQTHDLKWSSYKKTIKIEINEKQFLLLCTKMPSDVAVLRKLMGEINQRFRDRVKKKVYSEYDRTNKKADEIMNRYLATLDDNPEYQEYRSWFVPHERAVKLAEPKLFKIHPNCYEYQDVMIDTVLTI